MSARTTSCGSTTDTGGLRPESRGRASPGACYNAILPQPSCSSVTAGSSVSAAESALWSMPLHGPLTEGRCVRLGWPEEDELDAITALRNRAAVRKQFLDRRPLDPARNRNWLRSG